MMVRGLRVGEYYDEAQASCREPGGGDAGGEQQDTDTKLKRPCGAPTIQA